MGNEDLVKFAEVVYKRKQERLDMAKSIEEKEFNRLFLWLISIILVSVEKEYPPTGRIVRAFVCEKKSKTVHISISNMKDVFHSDFFLSIEQFEIILAKCLDFIQSIDHYEVLNRFPKDSDTEVREFMIAVNYSNYL